MVLDKEHRKMIRVYTVYQLELYLRTILDPQFNIEKYVGVPKQIKVKSCDLDKIIMPKIEQRKKLF